MSSRSHPSCGEKCLLYCPHMAEGQGQCYLVGTSEVVRASDGTGYFDSQTPKAVSWLPPLLNLGHACTYLSNVCSSTYLSILFIPLTTHQHLLSIYTSIYSQCPPTSTSTLVPTLISIPQYLPYSCFKKKRQQKRKLPVKSTRYAIAYTPLLTPRCTHKGQAV